MLKSRSLELRLKLCFKTWVVMFLLTIKYDCLQIYFLHSCAYLSTIIDLIFLHTLSPLLNCSVLIFCFARPSIHTRFPLLPFHVSALLLQVLPFVIHTSMSGLLPPLLSTKSSLTAKIPFLSLPFLYIFPPSLLPFVCSCFILHLIIHPHYNLLF